MRKIKHLIGALLFGTIAVNANPVALNTAQQVALNFYNHQYNLNASNETLVYTERAADGQAVYYVFNVNNNKGFVIVSAEDATIPVLGYSNEGPYVIPEAGNNVDFWMSRRKDEIVAIRTQNVKATADITDKWTSYANNTMEKSTHADMSAVSPLCKTTWDQSPYYNANCPHNCVTGCVATAMAQIMKYWGYPKIGVGTSCYFDEPTYGYTENYGELCEQYDTCHFAWPSMPDNVSSTNKEVAKLMYACGVSVAMNYTPTGSGSFVTGGPPSAQYAYPNYFGYVLSTLQGLTYSSYTASAWEGLLKVELNAGRPVQYEGADATYGGHSWVCDGYNASNDFHMNWGWSGNEDGYFAVSSLNPSPYDFSEDVGALMGIEPPVGLAVPEITNSMDIKVYPNPSMGEFTFEIPANMNNAELRMYNSIGQEIYTSKVSAGNLHIDMENQSAGIYLYRLVSENGSLASTGKLIIK